MFVDDTLLFYVSTDLPLCDQSAHLIKQNHDGQKKKLNLVKNFPKFVKCFEKTRHEKLVKIDVFDKSWIQVVQVEQFPEGFFQ